MPDEPIDVAVPDVAPESPKLTQRQQFDLARASKDAAAKCEALADRIKDEFQQADAENREPIPIEPLTEIRANLVLHAINQIKGDVSPELSSIIGDQRKSCGKLGTLKVLLLSEQLKMILDAAGIGGKDAPV